MQEIVLTCNERLFIAEGEVLTPFPGMSLEIRFEPCGHECTESGQTQKTVTLFDIGFFR